ncbi:MAG: hypothetical protein JOY64_03310 [Alphaproteobacteria bacterium]|nr:hypothetical protein [Alphaproteobacteria bacterium]
MSTLRFAIAFLAAPLLISLIELSRWARPPSFLAGALFGLPLSVAFLATVVIGYPVYFFLHRRQWTAFWVAPVAGFVVASLIWSLVGLAMLGTLGNLFAAAGISVDRPRRILWPYGPLGALIASLLWPMAWLERLQHGEP